MASGPITSWQIDGETMETVTNFIFGGSKVTADGDRRHEIKQSLLLGRKAVTNLDSTLKRRDIGWDGWIASLTWWTWVLASSGSLWWTGKPGVLQSMGLQRVGQDWVTELTENGSTTLSIWELLSASNTASPDWDLRKIWTRFWRLRSLKTRI